MINALRAGTIVAIVSGAMGWFMVLRRQTFVGHTLSLVGFPGAAGATLLGISPIVGYFAFCTVAAAVVSALPTGARARGCVEGARGGASGARPAPPIRPLFSARE